MSLTGALLEGRLRAVVNSEVKPPTSVSPAVSITPLDPPLTTIVYVVAPANGAEGVSVAVVFAGLKLTVHGTASFDESRKSSVGAVALIVLGFIGTANCTVVGERGEASVASAA